MALMLNITTGDDNPYLQKVRITLLTTVNNLIFINFVLGREKVALFWKWIFL